MNAVTHSLVGYDRSSERVAEEFVVPEGLLPEAKKLAGVPTDDPDAVRCYQLAPSQVHALARMLGENVNPSEYDYFLEGFATEDDRSELTTARLPVFEFLAGRQSQDKEGELRDLPSGSKGSVGTSVPPATFKKRSASRARETRRNHLGRK